MVEESTVPQGRFPGLAEESDVSPSIVVLAHRYGVLLGRAEEKVGVAAATRVMRRRSRSRKAARC